MGHHGQSPFNNLREDEFGKMFENNGADEFKKSMPEDQSNRIEEALRSTRSDLGATGNFPNGKLKEYDEGEIKIGITNYEDRVIIYFGDTPVKWIGFTKEQAKQIAESLLKHSE